MKDEQQGWTWPRGSLLGSLPTAIRERFLGLGTPLSVAASVELLKEGQRGTHMVLLRRAVTKVTVDMTDGRKALMAIRVSGDLVGEMSALSGAPRSATVTTCGPAKVSIIHQREWEPFFRRFPDAALAVAGNVGTRFRWANRRRVDFAAHPAKVRLARVLVDLTSAHGRKVAGGWEVGVDLTQVEIATLCGAAEPTVEKAFRELRSAGLVDTRYRAIVVRDLPGLHAFAGLSTTVDRGEPA